MDVKQADFSRPDSLAQQLRRRRMVHFFDLLDAQRRPVSLLDVGGTPAFWQVLGLDRMDGVSITVLNIDDVDGDDRIECLLGDARDLSRFGDNAFDVVFSNSVIEHVGDRQDQV